MSFVDEWEIRTMVVILPLQMFTLGVWLLNKEERGLSFRLMKAQVNPVLCLLQQRERTGLLASTAMPSGKG